MIIVNAAILLLAFIIALFSAFGLYPSFKWNTFFSFFPPVRFYLNAMKSIEKLQALGDTVCDDEGNRNTEQKQGRLHRGDVGFNELVIVLKENIIVEYEIEGIVLVEDSAGILIGNSPKIIRLICLENEGQLRQLSTHPFDPDKPMRDLKNWVEERYRKHLANWMMFVIVIWLLANSAMLYLLNR